MILLVCVILVIVFVILAIKNWRKVIGAGPTVLTVGAIFIIALIGFQFDAYINASRTYDACVERVERSVASRDFNQTLVDIVKKEVADRPDIADKLQHAMLPALKLSSCGHSPNFINASGSANDRH